MTGLFHRLDATYAALADGEIEARWRHGGEGDDAVDLAILRQLVLRAFDVIELTCIEVGASLGMVEHDRERASDEVAIRLLARLRSDRRVRNVRALAHKLALEVLNDETRSRSPARLQVADARPRLHLVREGRS